MHDTTRIDQLFDDARQILTIAQEVLQTAHTQTQNAIEERDKEITLLRDRICELELRLRDQTSLVGSDGGMNVDIHELTPVPMSAEPVTSHA